MFIWLQHYLDWKQRHFIFLRFLMERMRFKDEQAGKKRFIPLASNTTVSEAMKKIYRETYHYFSLREKNQFVEEKILLHAFFDKDKRLLPIEKLF